MMYDFTGTAIQQHNVTQQAASMSWLGFLLRKVWGYVILSTFWNAFIAICR